MADLLEADWENRFDKGRLSKATLNGYRANLKMVEKTFGNSLIAMISAKQVESYLHDTGNPEGERRVGSPALGSRRLFIIKKVVELALKQGLPADKAILEIHYYSEKKHERATYLSPAQVDRLIKVAKEGNASHYLPLAILLAVEHGASRKSSTRSGRPSGLQGWRDNPLPQDKERYPTTARHNTQNSRGLESSKGISRTGAGK